MSGSFQRLGFPVPRLDPPMGALSGGNLQRRSIAREMAKEPRLIVALYPRAGLTCAAPRRSGACCAEGGTSAAACFSSRKTSKSCPR